MDNKTNRFPTKIQLMLWYQSGLSLKGHFILMPSNKMYYHIDK